MFYKCGACNSGSYVYDYSDVSHTLKINSTMSTQIPGRRWKLINLLCVRSLTVRTVHFDGVAVPSLDDNNWNLFNDGDLIP